MPIKSKFSSVKNTFRKLSLGITGICILAVISGCRREDPNAPVPNQVLTDCSPNGYFAAVTLAYPDADVYQMHDDAKMFIIRRPDGSVWLANCLSTEPTIASATRIFRNLDTLAPAIPITKVGVNTNTVNQHVGTNSPIQLERTK